jgi:hypothetical protein
LHKAERNIADRLLGLCGGSLPWPWIDPDKALPWVGERLNLTFADSQTTAIRQSLACKALVITGGPGVGKTTIVKGILRILSAKGVKLLLCAPTGRAATRSMRAPMARRSSVASSASPSSQIKTTSATRSRRAPPAGHKTADSQLAGRLLPLQIRHMDCGCMMSMARMLAIRRPFGEVARRNRLNLDGEHGHRGERYSENELCHVNLRRLSNRHRPPWRAGAVPNRRTPDGSAAMHPALRAADVRGPHLEVLWIMSAMQSLSCVPRFLSLNALAIRTRSVEV